MTYPQSNLNPDTNKPDRPLADVTPSDVMWALPKVFSGRLRDVFMLVVTLDSGIPHRLYAVDRPNCRGCVPPADDGAEEARQYTAELHTGERARIRTHGDEVVLYAHSKDVGDPDDHTDAGAPVRLSAVDGLETGGAWTPIDTVFHLRAGSPEWWDHERMYELRYEENLTYVDINRRVGRDHRTTALILQRLGIHDAKKHSRLFARLSAADPDDVTRPDADAAPAGDDSWRDYYAVGDADD